MGTLLGCLILFILLAAGVHVSSVLFFIGAGAGFINFGQAIVLDFGNQVWGVLNNFVMTAAPLFILMGELLLRSGITDRMYEALSPWFSRMPGGLLHTNIAACAVLAANSGSSVATSATIGTVAIPVFRMKGYNDRIVLGSLAAGGTLGILIPPSINMIIYGSVADASVGRLFLGGIVPGIFLALSFMLIIFILAKLKPEIAGVSEPPVKFSEKLRTIPAFLPSLLIIISVMGSIYLGWATPTEAAALGVLSVFFMALLMGRINIAMLTDAFASTVKTTAMIYLIIIAAFYMNFVVSVIGIPQELSSWFVTLNLTPKVTLWMVVIFYLILGCFIETIAMMITTIPLVVPLVVSVGYDPVWFGVFLMILCEASLITPPIGMNLYVVQGIRKDQGPIKDVFMGALPFLAMMILMVGMLIYLPQIVLWLPSQIMG